MNAKNILNELSLEEKLVFLSGVNYWYTAHNERLGVPSVMMADGPLGLRKQTRDIQESGDIHKSVQSVAYPSPALTACSFNPRTLKKLGEHLGKEAKSEGVELLLGPGINIKRSPLGGRNFEYLSEDPFLTAELAKAYIIGVQSQQVGVTVKHFAANNRENQRFTNSSEVDERTLREIYLSAFESIIRETPPESIMAAYNKVNGVLATENQWLLKKILREEWHYQGVVMSDWTAVDEQAPAISAGLDLEMPGRGPAGLPHLLKAVADERLSVERIDEAVLRVLTMIESLTEGKTEVASVDRQAAHQAAVQIAEDSIVLLKNEQDVLPLSKGEQVIVIGALAEFPRYQGSGSSHVNPYQVVTPLEALCKELPDLLYAQGYGLEQTGADELLAANAFAAAAKADKILLFLGFPETWESEGFDKEDFQLPDNQLMLLEKLKKLNVPIIVLLQNGSPLSLTWQDDAAAILETYLAGEGVGDAVANILLGKVNPSGHLAETFPLKMAETPAFGTFNTSSEHEYYHEGIFVGYRFYEKKQIKPAFAFGHGLSYTDFTYSDLEVRQLEDKEVLVNLTIKNVGSVAGATVPQIYVGNQVSQVEKAVKELKAFDKFSLKAQESKRISFTLQATAFRWFNVDTGKWQVDSGSYIFYAGQSSEEIDCRQEVVLRFEEALPLLSKNTYLSDIYQNESLSQMFTEFFSAALAQSEFSELFEQARSRKIDLQDQTVRMLLNAPLRALVAQGLPEEALQQFVQFANQSLAAAGSGSDEV